MSTERTVLILYGSDFQADGPATEKERQPTLVLGLWTVRLPWVAEGIVELSTLHGGGGAFNA